MKKIFAASLAAAATLIGAVAIASPAFAVDDLTFDSPAPVQPDAKGCYPVPIPGQWNEV